MKYRSDIDGLRAVAVGSVLLYHAELLGVTGGFVGVDIFFVISGYLITRILRDDIIGQRFSLLRFYDRRIRRILPAYTLVAVVTTFAAYVILPPEELAAYGERLASTAAFVSNFLFRLDSGYFARGAGDNPLLHTWSLSVEEQFYLVWPIVIFVLMHPRFERWRRHILIAGLVSSFALAVYAVFSRPLAAFFYSPLRAWELLLGAMVAMDYFPKLNRGGREIAAALGAVFMVAPIFLYSNSTVFPGAAALPPCLGAALVIAAGRDGVSLTGRVLSFRPMVLTGLISYSLYLWHWPILVFTRIYLGHDLDVAETILALLASYALAIASCHYVERRFRKHDVEDRGSVPRSILAGVSALVALFAIGIATSIQEGWPARSNDRAAAAHVEMSLLARGPDGCMAEVSFGTIPKERGCLLGPGNEADVQAVLIGDSHAGAYAPAVDNIARELGFTARQWTKSSCSPALLGADSTTRSLFQRDRGEESCRRYIRAAIEKLVADTDVRAVIIAGFWSSYSDDKEANAARRPASLANQTRLRSGLGQFVAALRDAGKTVVLLGQVPVFPNGGGDCVVRQRFMERDDKAICDVPDAYVKALLSPSDSILKEISETYDNVYVYRGSLEFCSKGICSPTVDGHLAFRDEHHLTFGGSVYLAEGMKKVFQQAGFESGPRS